MCPNYNTLIRPSLIESKVVFKTYSIKQDLSIVYDIGVVLRNTNNTAKAVVTLSTEAALDVPQSGFSSG